MRTRLTASIAAFLAVLGAAGVCEAQTHQRWKLDYFHEKPQLYTHRYPTGELENYWYIYYTVSNNTTRVIPILLDHMMYIETGKELQTDLKKVDPDTARAAAEDSSKYEALKYGTFISNIALPEAIEFKVIEQHAKLGNRSAGIIRESIQDLKKGDEKQNRFYLNAREMREQRFIAANQKLTGMAIFKGVDPRAQLIEVHVSGLWDVLRIEQFLGEKEELEDVKIHYENRVLKYTYDFPGDAFNRARDVLVQKRQPQWVVKNIGPIASKTTIETLVSTLLKVLARWEELARENTPAAKIEEEIAKFNLNAMDFNISARVVSMAVGKDFKYDSARSLYENAAAVWKMHEWWVTNKNKLAFNEQTGRFEVREEVLPGTQKD
jgi:hypothetical protein